MTWNAAFPSSPLSRSALRGDTGLSAFSASDHSSSGSEEAKSTSSDIFNFNWNHSESALQSQSQAASTSQEGIHGSHLHSTPDPDGERLQDPMPEFDTQSTQSEDLEGLGVGIGAALLPPYQPGGLSNKAPKSSPKSRSPFSHSPPPRSTLNVSPSAQVQRRRFYGRQSSPLFESSIPKSDSTNPLQLGFSPSSSLSPSQSLMHSHSLLGSYEESLFSGRMASAPSAPLYFDAQLGVLGIGKCPSNLKCPPHLNLKFPARFYGGSSTRLAEATGESPIIGGNGTATRTELEGGLGSPYVGTVDLETHYWDQMLAAHANLGDQDLDLKKRDSSSPPSLLNAGASSRSIASRGDFLSSTHPPPIQSGSISPPQFPGYRIPPKGQIQLIIKNPNLTAVKLFLVPYDLSEMPAGTKTFIRQKCLASPPTSTGSLKTSSSPIGSKSPNTRSTRETLRYAIHLQFCAVAPSAKCKEDVRKESEGSQEWRKNQFDSRTTRRTRASLPDTNPHSVDKEAHAVKNSPRIYLHRDIRVVFAPRAPDKEERLTIVTETPGGPAVSRPISGSSVAMGGFDSTTSDKIEKAEETRTRANLATRDGLYASYSGPGEDWNLARKEAREKIRIREKGIKPRAGRANEPVEELPHTSSGAIAAPISPGAAERSQLQEGFFSSNVMVNSDPNGERWNPEKSEDGERLEDDQVGSFELGSTLDQHMASASSQTESGMKARTQTTLAPTSASLPLEQQRQTIPLSPTSQGYFNSTLPQPSRGTVSPGVAARVSSSDEDQALLDSWHHRLLTQSSQRSHSPSSRPISPGESGNPPSFSLFQSAIQSQSFSQAFDNEAGREAISPPIETSRSNSRPSSPVSPNSRSRGSTCVSRGGFFPRPTSPLANHQTSLLIASSSFNPNSPALSPSQHPAPPSISMSPHLLPLSRSRNSSFSRPRTPSLSSSTLTTTPLSVNGQISTPGLSEVDADAVQSQTPHRPALMRRMSSQSSNGSLNSSLKDSISSLKGLKLE